MNSKALRGYENLIKEKEEWLREWYEEPEHREIIKPFWDALKEINKLKSKAHKVRMNIVNDIMNPKL